MLPVTSVMFIDGNMDGRDALEWGYGIVPLSLRDQRRYENWNNSSFSYPWERVCSILAVLEFKYLSWVDGVDSKICHEGHCSASRGLPSDTEQ